MLRLVLVINIFISIIIVIHIINFSEFLLFADDLKIFNDLRLANDCKLLQSDTSLVQIWSVENYIDINIFKSNMISFTVIYFDYFFGDILIVRTAV